MYFVQALCTGLVKITLLTQFILNSFKKWLLRKNSKNDESKMNWKNNRSTEHVHQTESVYRGICGEWHVDFLALVVPRTLSLKAARPVLAPYIIYRHGTHSQNAIRSAGRISTTLAYLVSLSFFVFPHHLRPISGPEIRSRSKSSARKVYPPWCIVSSLLTRSPASPREMSSSIRLVTLFPRSFDRVKTIFFYSVQSSISKLI